MATYGKLTAGGITYDTYLTASIEGVEVARFTLANHHFALVKSKVQDGATTFAYAGKTYGVNPDGKDASFVIAGVTYNIGSPVIIQPPIVVPPVIVPSPSPSPLGLVKPSASNTGPKIAVVASGKPDVVAGKDIVGLSWSGTLNVALKPGEKLTIKDCKILGGIYGINCSQNLGQLTIINCDISGMASAGIVGKNFTARFNNIHHSSGDGFKPSENAVIESNWVHHLGWNVLNAHSDGVQIIGGKNVIIRGNFFDMDNSVPNTHSNAWLMIQNLAMNVLFTENWCLGGNFGINGNGDKSSVSTKNIIYKNKTQFGVCRSGAITWAGDNHFEDGTIAHQGDK